MKNKIKGKLIITLCLSFMIFSFSGVSLVKAEGEIDAIGVRIIPNPNNHSISRWYQEQGFSGSPQAIIVDGYEAIRDGRTVYVNAANVVDKDIYTNIYIISYNQNPSEKTIDILGQIVSRWKFNSNLQNLEESEPTCSISSYSCDKDEDCVKGSKCFKSGISANSCVLSEEVNCRIDSDCPSGFFCDSIKSKITRDIKRVGLLSELKNALSNYFKNKGSYPLLNSGTYLSNHSVSLWPSWQNNFLSEIASSPNFIDPINRLGYCPEHDNKTCWNAENNSFYSPAAETLVLPNGSYALAYSTNQSGSDYNICAVLESRHPSLNYLFAPNRNDNLGCVTDVGIISGGSSNNVDPVLIEYSLSGQAGKEFNGFIKVFDENNDPLKWEISRAGANWNSWSSDFPKVIDTSNKLQKKIYGRVAGSALSADAYPLFLRVSDGRGGVLEKTLNIDINDFSVFIEAQNAYHTLNKNSLFNYSIYVSGEKFANPQENNNVNISRVSGEGSLPSLFDNSNRVVELVGNNRYKISYSSAINPESYQFPLDAKFEFKITASDKNGTSFEKNFFLNLISEKPILKFSCPLTTRATKDYSCLLGRNNYLGNNIFYSISGQPSPLKIETKEENDNTDIFILGKSSIDSAIDGGIHEVSVSAISDYGAINSKNFKLKVNTSCGDGYKQSPNTEGRGGLYNDGQEQCDGDDGTTNSAIASNKDLQYGCNTNTSSIVPIEIVSRNFCIFKGPLNGGGYCGDGFCQTKYEDGSNCDMDCEGSPSVVPEEPESPAISGCLYDEDCSEGFNCIDKVCERKYFHVLETVSLVKFSEGDEFKNGNLIKKDDPKCRDNKNYSKPYGNQSPDPKKIIVPQIYNEVKMVGIVMGKDTCKKSGSYPNMKDCSKGVGNWKRTCLRYRYVAKQTKYVKRYFEDACRPSSGSTEENGKMNASGQCIVESSNNGQGGDGSDACRRPCETDQDCFGRFNSCVENCCSRDFDDMTRDI